MLEKCDAHFGYVTNRLLMLFRELEHFPILNIPGISRKTQKIKLGLKLVKIVSRPLNTIPTKSYPNPMKNNWRGRKWVKTPPSNKNEEITEINIQFRWFRMELPRSIHKLEKTHSRVFLSEVCSKTKPICNF